MREGVACTFLGTIQQNLAHFIGNAAQHCLPQSIDDMGTVDRLLRHGEPRFDWLVIDTPHFVSKAETGPFLNWDRVLLIDDEGKAIPPCANAVLNPNYGAREDMYDSVSADLLVGQDFILLRPEILETPRTQKDENGPLRILVSMGGADPYDLTTFAAKSLRSLDGVEVTIVCGPANARLSQYMHQFGSIPNFTVSGPTEDFGPILNNSDIAVISAGGTLWEALFMGCEVYSYSVNETQASILSELERKEELCYLGDVKRLDTNRIDNILQHTVLQKKKRSPSSRIVDGKGVSRVVSYMLRGD